MSKVHLEDQIRFLLSCVKHSNNGKVNMAEVISDCAITTKGAATKRYNRLMNTYAAHLSDEKSEKSDPLKRKVKAGVYQAAEAKRRKLEGDQNGPAAVDGCQTRSSTKQEVAIKHEWAQSQAVSAAPNYYHHDNPPWAPHHPYPARHGHPEQMAAENLVYPIAVPRPPYPQLGQGPPNGIPFVFDGSRTHSPPVQGPSITLRTPFIRNTPVIMIEEDVCISTKASEPRIKIEGQSQSRPDVRSQPIAPSTTLHPEAHHNTNIRCGVHDDSMSKDLFAATRREPPNAADGSAVLTGLQPGVIKTEHF